MKLIVGLGNPGKEFENTRHNVGFMAIDFYAKKNNLTFKKKFNGSYSETTINNEKVIILKPQTFMNLSGECIIRFINFFNIEYEDILIIYDDIDFKFGEFKIKRGGSSAGHNGIKNTIHHLKTEDLKRVRIGIDKNTIPLEDYVLQKMSKEQLKTIEKLLEVICDVIDDFPLLTIDELMEKYNRNSNE